MSRLHIATFTEKHPLLPCRGIFLEKDASDNVCIVVDDVNITYTPEQFKHVVAQTSSEHIFWMYSAAKEKFGSVAEGDSITALMAEDTDTGVPVANEEEALRAEVNEITGPAEALLSAFARGISHFPLNEDMFAEFQKTIMTVMQMISPLRKLKNPYAAEKKMEIMNRIQEINGLIYEFNQAKKKVNE